MKNLRYAMDQAIHERTPEELGKILASHGKTLQLIDEKGRWFSPLFEKKKDVLLPTRVSHETLEAFIDDIVKANMKNEYLRDFLIDFKLERYKTLGGKVETEGDHILPDVLMYAYLLENLCQLFASDYHYLEEHYHHLEARRKETGAFKLLPLFHKIKMISVAKPLRDNYLASFKTGEINPKAGGIAVAINILEATWTDYKSGIKGNAQAGWVLAKNRCGKLQVDTRTGVGPSGFSKDQKMIQRSYPLGLEWAALYQVWNLCFCTRFQDFPYVISKLIIPQVANYHEEPKNYIYNRAMALYLYLNFSCFDYMEKKKTGEPIINWFSRDLSLDFAKNNKIAAKTYEELLIEKTRIPEGKIKTMQGGK